MHTGILPHCIMYHICSVKYTLSKIIIFWCCWMGYECIYYTLSSRFKFQKNIAWINKLLIEITWSTALVVMLKICFYNTVNDKSHTQGYSEYNMLLLFVIILYLSTAILGSAHWILLWNCIGSRIKP